MIENLIVGLNAAQELEANEISSPYKVVSEQFLRYLETCLGSEMGSKEQINCIDI